MTAADSATLLRLPAWHGARLLLRAQLDELQAAHGRFPGDEEALHDFRVALRRLRSALASWRATVEPGMERRGLARRACKALAQSTSLARDAEVQRALLDDEAGRLSPEDESAGVRLVLHERAHALRQEEQHAYARLASTWHQALPLVERLRRRLRVCRVDIEAEQPSFGRVLGRHLAARLRGAEEAVAAVEAARSRSTAELMARAHRLRIAVKHVRYTLDPVAESPSAAPLIKSLKKLQDALGLLHDVALAEERPTPPSTFARPGSAISDEAWRRLRAHWAARRSTLFAELDGEWLAGARIVTLWSALHALGKGLEAQP